MRRRENAGSVLCLVFTIKRTHAKKGKQDQRGRGEGREKTKNKKISKSKKRINKEIRIGKKSIRKRDKSE